MTGLAHRGFAWDDYRRHVVDRLSHLGYTTALCGVQHVAPERTMLGYDQYLDGGPGGDARNGRDARGGPDYFDMPNLDPASYDRANAQRAAEWIKQKAGASSQAGPPQAGPPQAGPPQAGPWFLSVGFLATHRPFPEASEVTTPEEDRAAYRRSAEELDRSVGTVLAALDRDDLWDSTVVLFTTDHGVPFPGHKGDLRDSGTRVALMLRVPSGAAGREVSGPAEPAGEVYDHLVSQIDLFPTILELAGDDQSQTAAATTATRAGQEARGQEPVGAPWIARSILPMIEGRSENVRDAVYAESNYHAAYEPARSIRTDRYRLITRPADTLTRAPANTDDCPEKELLRPTGWFDQDHPQAELYDVATDPEEETNLATDARYAAIRDALTERITDWMYATNDPLLHGVVEAPSGAIVDSFNQWSPS
jgi:arylsulfatase A-like enzyme